MLRLNYEDAAWLWLESKPWAVTPELLFHAKQLIKDEAKALKGVRLAAPVRELDCFKGIKGLELGPKLPSYLRGA